MKLSPERELVRSHSSESVFCLHLVRCEVEPRASVARFLFSCDVRGQVVLVYRTHRFLLHVQRSAGSGGPSVQKEYQCGSVFMQLEMNPHVLFAHACNFAHASSVKAVAYEVYCDRSLVVRNVVSLSSTTCLLSTELRMIKSDKVF